MPGTLDSAGWDSFMMAFTSGFPDSRIAIESCLAEGDTVATRWTMTGTHRGVFQGVPATGREFRIDGIEFNRVVDGKIVQHWAMFDNLALLQQIPGNAT